MPGLLRLQQQAATGEEQGIALLSGQVRTAGQFIRQTEQTLVPLLAGQAVLVEQGQDQRIVAQHAAVIVEPLLVVTLDRQASQQGVVGPWLVAHFLQGHSQVHQRQTRTGVTAPLEQRTQGAQRRLLAARQHITGVGLHGKAGLVGVVAVAVLDNAALLQVTQQPLVGLFQGLGRHGKTLLTGAQEEVGDVGTEPVFLVTVGAPQAEAAVVALHAEQAFDAQLNGLAALFGRLALDP